MIFPIVITIIFTGCLVEANNAAFMNESENVIINEFEKQTTPLSSDSEKNIESSYNREQMTIQDLFSPKLVTIFIEGMPELIHLYPFGEIVEPSKEGMVSYVVFVDDFYHAEQQENLLRIVPYLDMPPTAPKVFMEIKQIPNITVEEMEDKIKSTIDISHYYFFFHEQATEDFPFVKIEFFDSIAWDSIVTVIYIKDNSNNGVFVITAQYSYEAIGGHGVRFLNILRSLEIIKGE